MENRNTDTKKVAEIGAEKMAQIREEMSNRPEARMADIRAGQIAGCMAVLMAIYGDYSLAQIKADGYVLSDRELVRKRAELKQIARFGLGGLAVKCRIFYDRELNKMAENMPKIVAGIKAVYGEMYE